MAEEPVDGDMDEGALAQEHEAGFSAEQIKKFKDLAADP
jgi:DNA replication licensing factor MCM4